MVDDFLILSFAQIHNVKKSNRQTTASLSIDK